MAPRAVAALLVLAACAVTARAEDDVILRPTKTDGAEAALVFIQGASIPAARYVPFAQALQAAVDFPLWVAIPAFLLDVPEPLVLAGGIARVTKNMTAQGMRAGATFLGGHSLGGAMLIDYTATTGANATAQFLLGAFLTRKYANVTYPVKTLTVGAELDGLCLVSRITEAYWHRVLHPRSGDAGGDDAATAFPVVVLPGQNHMQFASGEPPALVKARDLHAEVTDEAARAAVVAVVADWLALQRGDASAAAGIKAAVAATGALVGPLVQAMEVEGNTYLKPACDLNPVSPACFTGAGTWTETAQVAMGGVDASKVKQIVTNTFHDVWEIFPHVHLPKVWHNCTGGAQDACWLNVTTVSQNVYDSDPLDTGFGSNTASEIRAKMVSRQWMQTAAGAPTPFAADNHSLCAAINDQAYKWALARAPARTAARFAKYGEPYVMGADDNTGAVGPLWIWAPMQYHNTTGPGGAAVVEVVAPTMMTPLNETIKAAAGFHYCKLLSPARAMEWAMVDGLRAHYTASKFPPTAAERTVAAAAAGRDGGGVGVRPHCHATVCADAGGRRAAGAGDLVT
eukprot:CAMPEP_0203810304 /NCGR_PEP_ID=MMETSP0115-20131106/2845_1 /ASSEMBLY_ACC=CAM_ASM_000227 /TAXON_ID=33651 /ORGANISM="Bicosoecid sp, Strain ms1" /LENGTH=569 /DNA_ID=CAMNT_0050719093 /DNA_START=81 /DNA_END=1791 /DNA_ORIENTATION=+